jgi:hypothetical protein
MWFSRRSFKRSTTPICLAQGWHRAAGFSGPRCTAAVSPIPDFLVAITNDLGGVS